MAISYPISLPAGGRVALTFKPYAVVAKSMSPYTLQQQVQAHQGQIWVVHVQLMPLLPAEAAEWIAALLSLNGTYGTFYLGDDSSPAIRGSGSGTPLVKGAAQVGQVLLTDGWTGSQTNILRKGDWIQIGASTTQRIYRCLKDVNSDSGGNATLDIWPRLRESPADNAALVLAATKGVFRLTHNDMPWSVDSDLLSGIEFECAEAL